MPSPDALCMVPGFKDLPALRGRCVVRLLVQGERHCGTNYVRRPAPLTTTTRGTSC